MNLHKLHEGRPTEILDYSLPRVDVTEYGRKFIGISAHNVVSRDAELQSIEDIEFGNCHFGESGLFQAHYKNCTFTNCQFGLFKKLKTIFENCTFENCTFWDRECSVLNNSAKVYFENCTFVDGFESLCACYTVNSHWTVPKEGPFTMYKKVWVGYRGEKTNHWREGIPMQNYTECIGIVQLRVPAEAKRWFDPESKKVRVSEAYVAHIEVATAAYACSSSIDKERPGFRQMLPNEIAFSGQDKGFMYAVGETVRPQNGFSSAPQPCESGIHGFASRDTAEDYVIFY